jgi:hypothetical protein
MTTLQEAYERKDRSRLEVGWCALEEINQRIAKDAEAGITSPHRTALSEILEELSVEFSSYHKSQSACRSYLRDSIRLGRHYGQDLVEELAQYHLTTSHLLATIVRGEWPDCDIVETGLLLDWAIKNHATPSEIWDHRRQGEAELSDIEKAKRRLLSALTHYLDTTAIVLGYDKERKVCTDLIKIFEEPKSHG